MGEIPSAYTNQEVGSRNKKSPAVLIVVIILIIFAAVFFILRLSKNTQQKKESAVITSEPTPTAKPKIDKTKVKIQVQNGTGTPGQAGTVVEVLKKAGYNSDNIKTTNAKEYTNTVTTITAKSGFEDVANDIKASLESTFTVINIDSAKLDSSGDFDVVVITGGKIFEPATTTITPTQTPTPTVTPTPTP